MQKSLNLIAISVLLITLSLSGCTFLKPKGNNTNTQSQTIPPFQVSQSHKSFTSGLAKSQATKGNSYQGKWIFTILQKDRQLLKGIVVNKSSYDAQKKQSVITAKINSSSIPPEEVVYAGFTSLDANGGYDVITNNANSRHALTNFQVKGNRLKWSLIYQSPEDVNKLFSQKMLFHTDAQYDPNGDVLIGATSFGMQMLFTEVDERGNKVAYRRSLVPMGSYRWQATRISDADFAELAQPNSYNEKLPQYSLGIDTSTPEIRKYMFAKTQ